MKTYTLTCECGKTLTVSGKDVDDILSEIDKSGWRDRPRPDMDKCPDCIKVEEEEYEADNYW